jgi:hypothetical protein
MPLRLPSVDNARTANTEASGNRCRTKLLLAAKAQDLSDIDRRLAALVDAARLGSADALELALTTEIDFEFGKDAEHVEKCLAGGGACVDRLLGRPQRHTPDLELVHDVLQVLQRARQAVDAGDDERVASA